MQRPKTLDADDKMFVAALESATLDADAWVPMVELLKKAFGCEVAGINSVDLVTGSITTAHHIGLSATAQAEYYDHLALNDPRIPMVGAAPVGSAVTDAAVAADPAARKTEYYAWEAKQAFSHTLCIKLVHTPGDISSIALARRKGSGAHSDDTLASAQALAPRLAAAAAVNKRLAALESLNGMLDRALAAGASAFAIYSRGAVLLHANAAFKTALNRRDGLSNGTTTTAVRATVDQGRPRALLVPRPHNRTPYRLVLQPVAAGAAEQRRFDWGRQGAVLAFLDDPDAGVPGNRAPLLQQLFGLTMAEARVAMLVADGEEVEAIAARLGVATSTVRTQLKSVFTKMGVSRQLGVARLVRGLPQFDG